MLTIRKLPISLLMIPLLLTFAAGCGGKGDDEAVARANRAPEAVAQDHAHDHGHGHGDSAHAAEAPGGEVLEILEATKYTYARVATVEGEVWAAGPKTVLEVGQHVDLRQPMLMKDFASRDLDRTFEEIWFVGGFGGEDPAVQQELQRAHAGLESAPVPGVSVTAAAGGVDVAGAHGLGAGDAVLLRAQVVKANYGILGTNWYHVRDGSGEAGTDDLTVTSTARAEVGDVVLIRGSLSLDRDFGSGYRYERIVEDAELTVDAL